MPRQSEIDRMIVLLYRSSNAHGFTNYTRYSDWLDKLPMDGLHELSAMFENMRQDVEREVAQRIADGMPVYPREWYEQQKAEAAAGAEILRMIGVNARE